MDVTTLFYLPARVLLVAPVPCLFLLQIPSGYVLTDFAELRPKTAQRGSNLRRWWLQLEQRELGRVLPWNQRKRCGHDCGRSSAHF